MTDDKFPDLVTIGDKYRPAMEIADQGEADAYFERCVEHCMRGSERTREEAEAIERSNLGYFAGYYGRETMERVNRLYRTAHPIFGTTAPTAKQAFEAGKALAGGASQ